MTSPITSGMTAIPSILRLHRNAAPAGTADPAKARPPAASSAVNSFRILVPPLPTLYHLLARSRRSRGPLALAPHLPGNAERHNRARRHHQGATRARAERLSRRDTP